MTVESTASHPPARSAIEFRFLSPCVSEEKDQDRAKLVRQENGWVGVLCDGTTQSMHSADAAEIATLNPSALWTENGVADVVALLNQRRESLIAEAKDEEPYPASFLRSTMVKFMRDARERSFQTTLVTARVMPADDGRFVIEAKTVGDSALLIFDSGGQLLCSNPPIADRDAGFGHLSSITQVLPDHFTTDEITIRKDVDSGTHVVLCSDGFYDAFRTPGELFDWLLEHEDDFRTERAKEVIGELHGRLDRRIGDDDVSFLWLCARAAPEEEADDPALVLTASPPASARTESWLYRIFAAFLRRLRALFSRSTGRVHGDNAS
jgi:hypothetical protein